MSDMLKTMLGDARRERDALRVERDALAAKLDAIEARLEAERARHVKVGPGPEHEYRCATCGGSGRVLIATSTGSPGDNGDVWAPCPDGRPIPWEAQ